MVLAKPKRYHAKKNSKNKCRTTSIGVFLLKLLSSGARWIIAKCNKMYPILYYYIIQQIIKTCLTTLVFGFVGLTYKS